MSTMQSAKDRQDNEMADMRKEISTLTRALTTLTHKMVEKSSRRGGGGGYESDGGYKTEESKKENTRPRRPNKRKSLKVDTQNKPLTADDEKRRKPDLFLEDQVES